MIEKSKSRFVEYIYYQQFLEDILIKNKNLNNQNDVITDKINLEILI